jgi:hypothetical protein
VLFVAGELLLALAIPFIAIEGYHTLLDSRAGKFVAEPTRSDPGWLAVVEPTPVVAAVEVDQGTVTGAALIIHHPEVSSAATVLLVPGSLELGGDVLSAMAPDEVGAALAAELRQSLSRVEVLDQAAWADVLGDATLSVESPDPVPGTTPDTLLFAVGPVEVGGAEAAAFLGRPAPGAAEISTQPRRHLFWNALLAQPPTTETALAEDLRSFAGAPIQVLDLPLSTVEPVARLDGAATEALLHEVVAYPSGAAPGDRLSVRIVDRTGDADLEGVAAAVAALGFEVVEIGNAQVFDGGPTDLVVPSAMQPVGDTAGADGPVGDGATEEVTEEVTAEVARLARFVGISTVTVDPVAADLAAEDQSVTLVIGGDFSVEPVDR